MKYTIIPVTPFVQNCALFWCTQKKEAVVVDPGGDIDKIISVIDKLGVTLTKIILTHGHLDHICGAEGLSKHFGVPIYGPHVDDRFLLEGLPLQCRKYGFPETSAFLPIEWLKDGDKIQVGSHCFEVIHTPGHTPGHISYFLPQENIVLVGDVLFAGSIGRTYFPRSDYQQLIFSIKNRLLPLGDDITFIPGHGPKSTFGEERRSNPFLL